MKTVTIPEMEYLKMQQLIAEMQQKLSLLNDQDFLQKLNLAYRYFFNGAPASVPQNTVSIKHGSGKHLIKYIADDFTAPIDEFKDYM